MAQAAEPAPKLIIADQAELVRNLLDASGQRKNLGFDLEFPSFAGGPAILEAIRAGALDIAYVGDPNTVEASKSRVIGYVEMTLKENLTLRQLLRKLAGARGHFVATGTPEDVADIIEDWFRTGAADGFNVMPPIINSQLTLFAEEVVPILQKRGLYRTDYSGDTLRSHFGLGDIAERGTWAQSA